MSHLLLVFLGGGLGAALRHLANGLATKILGHGFPWGTLFVNIAGSLAMGLFIAWLVRRSGGTNNELRLFFATGFLGGFTTFSAFSLDVANLFERGEITQAALYALTSVMLSIAAVFIGLWFGRAFL